MESTRKKGILVVLLSLVAFYLRGYNVVVTWRREPETTLNFIMALLDDHQLVRGDNRNRRECKDIPKEKERKTNHLEERKGGH